MNSAGSVGLAGLVVHLADDLGDHGVTDRSSGRLAMPPHVEPGHRHADHPAGHLDREAVARYLRDDLPAPFGPDWAFSNSFAW